jgi:hypothetical protein
MGKALYRVGRFCAAHSLYVLLARYFPPQRNGSSPIVFYVRLRQF